MYVGDIGCPDGPSQSGRQRGCEDWITHIKALFENVPSRYLYDAHFLARLLIRKADAARHQGHPMTMASQRATALVDEHFDLLDVGRAVVGHDENVQVTPPPLANRGRRDAQELIEATQNRNSTTLALRLALTGVLR